MQEDPLSGVIASADNASMCVLSRILSQTRFFFRLLSRKKIASAIKDRRYVMDKFMTHKFDREQAIGSRHVFFNHLFREIENRLR